MSIGQINFKRIDHIMITVPVGKQSEARVFYKDLMELEEIGGEHPRGAMWFKVGDIELHVRQEAESSFSDRHPAFEVENLEAAKLFLQGKDITIAYSSEIDGRQRCFFRDPFGNRFELLEHLK
jgi:catechol 2,3-dioxygenase-like lactoylglutathione lyase family enzyme